MRTRVEGGSDRDQNTHFVRRFIENATFAVESVGSKGLSAQLMCK